MKKILFIIIFTCNYIYSSCQVNIVKNPSFEQYSHCPNALGEIAYTNYWNGLDSIWVPGSTDTTGFAMSRYLPEFVHTCGTSGDVSVPNNYDFYHYPRTGNGMVQQQMFYDYLWGLSVGVDYLQGRLYHPLIAGQSYCVTFYVVLEDHTGYAINHIGAYLDNGIIDTTTRMMRYQTEYTPQVVGTTVIYDTTNWTKIQGNFIANGTESFITIGNFFDTGGTTHPYYGAGCCIALYLVDDVSVIASDAHANAGADVSITAGDSTYIGIDSNGEGMPCYWYTLGEPIAIDSGGRILVHPAGTTTYIVEMDLCGTITRDTVTVHVWSVGVNPTLKEEFLHIYPNPAKDNFVIEGAMGCEMKIYNVVGQEMFEQKITTSKEEININSLTKGIYVIEILEPETGMKLSKRIIKL